MASIEMHGVEKAYGENRVLRGLDLTVEEGEIFSLLGPNGAGKTTAVEILEGYRRIDGGRVSVLGFDPATGGAAFRAKIGIVLQETTAFSMSTVREIVEMFAALFPDPMGVDEVIDLVGLSAQRDQVSESMSGGQRRRLDVACGLVGRPELLFLDEPTTGLDPEARRGMWGLVRDLRDSGRTVLLTTHYLDEAEALADRIGILIGGELQDVASPSAVGGRDGSTARVQFRPSEAMAGQLEGWTRDGDVVWTETDTPTAVVADLAGRHGELDGLIVRRQSLEDVYLEMVSRHHDAEARS